MTTPNQQLANLICVALQQAGITNEKEATALKSRILTGKVKAEDWYLAIENTISEKEKGAKDGQ